MATKANPGEFDCYAEAGDDEPIFILRATDGIAPDVIRYWADTYELYKQMQNGIAYHTGPLSLTERQQRKAKEARTCADAMDEWRKEQEGKDRT